MSIPLYKGLFRVSDWFRTILCKQHGLNSKHVLEKEMTGKYVAIFGLIGKILKGDFLCRSHISNLKAQ